MTIEPFSGLSSPMRVLRNTDLPVPDGPSRTLTSPGGSVSVTSDQMFARPNDFERPSTRTSTPVIAGSSCARRANDLGRVGLLRSWRQSAKMHRTEPDSL
jgi:hypothetical protein